MQPHGNGHNRRTGFITTLPELISKFGADYSAMEIMFWYTNAQKCPRKRPHPWGSPTVGAAAKERYEEYGHYGHRES